MALTASNDINNLGGSVIAQDSLNLNAGNNINIQSTTQDSAYSTSKTLAGDKAFSSTATGTNIDRIAGLYVTGGANSLLVAQAGNDLNINAAEINNTSTDGFTLLKANRNINLGTVTENTHSYTTVKGKGSSGWTDQTSQTETGSRIDTTGDITLEAGNNVSAKAAQVASDNGALNVVAGQDISIVNGTRTDTSQSYSKKSSKGFLSSKSKTRYDTSADMQVIASTFSGDSVNLSAGQPVNDEEAVGGEGNITIRGSNVVASNDVNINASNNVSITAAQATHDETHTSKTKKSGFTASSTSIGYGSSKLTNTNDTQTTTNIGSTVGSVEGNVNINAGKDYTQTASDILTPSGDINITAQEVTIKAATDTYANQQSMKYKQSGITVSVSSSALNLAKGVAATTEAAVTSDSNGNKVLNALQTYANGSTLYEQGKAAAGAVQTGNVQDAARAAGVKLSVSIGSTSAKSSSSTNIATQQDSLIKASGNVTIKAMQDDLMVKGSQIEADKNITLEAAKNINLVASADTESNQSKNKSSSTSMVYLWGLVQVELGLVLI